MNRRPLIVFLLWLTAFPLMADILPNPEVTFISAENNQVTMSGSVIPIRRLTAVGFQIREVGKKRFRRAAPKWQRDFINVPGSSTLDFSVTATVKEDTGYQCRAVAIYGGVRRYGGVHGFHSSAFPPQITSLSATRIDNSTFVLNATANPLGRPSWARFYWGTNPPDLNPTTPQYLGDGTNAIAIEAVLTDLITNQTYFYYLSATNALASRTWSGIFYTVPPVISPTREGSGVILSRLRGFD